MTSLSRSPQYPSFTSRPRPFLRPPLSTEPVHDLLDVHHFSPLRRPLTCPATQIFFCRRACSQMQSVKAAFPLTTSSAKVRQSATAGTAVRPSMRSRIASIRWASSRDNAGLQAPKSRVST